MSMPDTAPPFRSRASRWLWAAGIVLVVAGAGLATWAVTRSTATPPGAATQPADPTPRLTVGHDYYLHVKLIELSERRPDGKTWDSIDGSGPDVCFSLTWRNNVIWKSAEKSNTLIGSWDLMKVDVRQMLTSSAPTDLGELVNAPLVHCERGGVVELKVWDADTVGSDDAGAMTSRLDELRPGENTLLPPTDKSNAVRRVVLAAIDRRTPVPDLVNMISNR
jgi:hypothetical protein